MFIPKGTSSFSYVTEIFSNHSLLLCSRQAVSFLFALHIFCKNPAYLGFFRVKQDFDHRDLSSPKKMYVKKRIDILCKLTINFTFRNCSRISSLYALEESKKDGSNAGKR